jgi:uncharacterized protein (DUF1778 family)
MVRLNAKGQPRQKTKKPSKLTTVRIPRDVYERLTDAAIADRRTLSNFLVTSAEIRADQILGAANGMAAHQPVKITAKSPEK